MRGSEKQKANRREQRRRKVDRFDRVLWMSGKVDQLMIDH